MLVSSSLSYDGLDAVPSYGYSYDNIGNRKTAQEPAGELAYAANGLNQYTGIEESGEAPQPRQSDHLGMRLRPPGTKVHEENHRQRDSRQPWTNLYQDYLQIAAS